MSIRGNPKCEEQPSCLFKIPTKPAVTNTRLDFVGAMVRSGETEELETPTPNAALEGAEAAGQAAFGRRGCLIRC